MLSSARAEDHDARLCSRLVESSSEPERSVAPGACGVHGLFLLATEHLGTKQQSGIVHHRSEYTNHSSSLLPCANTSSRPKKKAILRTPQINNSCRCKKIKSGIVVFIHCQKQNSGRSFWAHCTGKTSVNRGLPPRLPFALCASVALSGLLCRHPFAK